MQRVEFTKEMKKTHTILFPNMCNIHFQILEKVFNSYGYKIKLLRNTDSSVINEGLKYVHNDMCYPALLTTGQLIDALKSGEYDLEKTALIMSQTGGGCRASNYINVLRKALVDAGMSQIPVISFSLNNMEKHGGFKLTLPLMRRMLAAVIYGDLLMALNNQTKPYEINKEESNDLVNFWIEKIKTLFEHNKAYQVVQVKKTLREIVSDFSKIQLNIVPKVKVGIVGEIYVKYSPLANNNLEKFLFEQDCEVMVPGILQFFMFCTDNSLVDFKLYGGNPFKKNTSAVLLAYIGKFEKELINAYEGSSFVKPGSYQHLKHLAEPILGQGCKMGEGWLLTAEMLELLENGYNNIICAQPFGCLPNHIVGKGMARKILNHNSNANITPIDYDPGASIVNQENRIKLMLSIAREKIGE